MSDSERGGAPPLFIQSSRGLAHSKIPKPGISRSELPMLAIGHSRFIVEGVTTVIATRRFTVEEYHRMAETGILKPDDRVELLDGDIIPGAPMSSRHAAAVSKIAAFFQRTLAGKAIVRVQSPIRSSDYSEPEPDVALVHPDYGYYASAHPGPTDVMLLIEVAHSSLAFDREVKMPQYARAGIVETWLVNLEQQHVEVFREPGPQGYATTSVHRRDAALAPYAFPEALATVGDLLA